MRGGQAAGVGTPPWPAGWRHSSRDRRPVMGGWRRGAGRPGTDGEKGAVAVEFALVLPVFVLLVLGIFEFGRAFNIQVSLSEAARESARYAAVHAADPDFSTKAAQAAGVAAAPSVPLKEADVGISYRNSDGSTASSCGSYVSVASTVTYSTVLMTGLGKMIGLEDAFTVTGQGVMRCGG